MNFDEYFKKIILTILFIVICAMFVGFFIAFLLFK